MKKLKRLLLALLFLATSVGVHAYAKNEIVKFGQFYYKVLVPSGSDASLCFLGCDDAVTGELTIPATVSDGIDLTFKVTEVGGSEAHNCRNITDVVVPEGVTKMNQPIFRLAELKTLSIPKSLTEIARSADYTMRAAPVWTVDPENPAFTTDSDGALYTKDMKKLRSVPSSVALDNGTYTVNPDVDSIMFDAFLVNRDVKKIILPANLKGVQKGYPSIVNGCGNLAEFEVAGGGTTNYYTIAGVLFEKEADNKTLVIYPQGKKTENYQVPEGVTKIEAYGIASNSNMLTIDLNDVVEMAKNAIVSDSKLTTITLTTNMKAGTLNGAISDCKQVERYIVPEDCVNYTGDDGVVYDKSMKTLLFYPPARAGETYDIPSSVETIADFAFRSSQNITSLFIPNNVKTIGQQAFREMTELTKLEFEEPSQITTFGPSICMYCHKLKEVTLPASLTTYSGAMYGCENLETVIVPDGSQLTDIQGQSFITNLALREVIFQGSSVLKTIGSNAFANLPNLERFDVPATVTDISNNAFQGCSSLATVTFPDNSQLRQIRQGAFANCGLKEITIPESVTTIEREAFTNCEAMTEVNLSANISSISPEAFKHCWTLDNINVDKDNKVYSSVDGYLLSGDKETLIMFPPGKANSNFTLLPPSITKIGDWAFYDCKNLENVVIPNKVTAIGARAFGLCDNLNTVTFLCDEMIDPSNIDQSSNGMSFDDSTIPNGDMFKHINTYVRRDQVDAYRNDRYYQQFNVVGTTFFENGNEYIPVSKTTVDLVAVGNTDHTFVVPTTATGKVLVDRNDEQEQTYQVHLIGDYAFQNTTDAVKEVVVKQHVQYIGAKAFMTDIKNNTSTIEKVFFIQKEPTARMLSTTRFELDETGTNYNEFAANTKVYVKKNSLKAYQEAWTKTTYDKNNHSYEPSSFDFTSQLDYRIPDVAIGTKYSTFAREFDTDFSDYFAERGRNDIGAFVAKKAVRNTSGDYGQTEWHVKMTSVDMHGGYTGSYGYVPANTGVLLKVLVEEKTANDFYYTIGEQDETEYNVTDNIMTGVTVNNQNVAATDADPIYVISGGTFHKVTQNIKMPVHKAYMRLGEELTAGAKVLFIFDDTDETVTAIDGVHVSPETSGHVYNLSGQRVSDGKMNKGVYIARGKKVVIR